MMRVLILSMLLAAGLCGTSATAPREEMFDDPLFRRCVSWMLDGQKGALIESRCLDRYGIPPPSLFLCARKVQTGFASAVDRETCAVIYDEEANKVRAGYIHGLPTSEY
jgi:hypothetical protein